MSKRAPIGIMLIALFMIIIVVRFLVIVDTPLLSSIKYSDSEYNLSIEPFYDEADDLYILFIPAYTNAENIKLSKSNFINVEFYDDMANYKDDIKSIPLNTQVKMRLSNFNNSEEYNIMIMQSSNLSTVYIETESQSMDYINASKNNEEDASLLIIDPNGEIAFEGMTTITGRGNSTWRQVKKPYNLKFDEKVTLNGTDSEKTWFLLANYADESQIRNAIGLYAANLLGIPYTSTVEFISLYINGEYEGLYNIGTKDKYLDNTTTSIAAVFEMTSSKSKYDWISDNGTYIRFRYGDGDLISTTVNNFENALFADIDFESLDKYIDISSFAYKYYLEEFLANHDIDKGQYFAIDYEGKISAITAWDYDLILGISWNQYYDISYNQEMQSNVWYAQLMNYIEFKNYVVDIFNNESTFLAESIAQYMTQCYEQISNDWYLNAIRWENETSFDDGRTQLKSTEDDISLEENIVYINEFIQNRIEYLRRYWLEPNTLCYVTFSDTTIGSTSIYCEKGQIISPEMLPDGLLTIDLPGFLGWYTEDGISITNYGVITENVTFYAAWESDENLQEAA